MRRASTHHPDNKSETAMFREYVTLVSRIIIEPASSAPLQQRIRSNRHVRLGSTLLALSLVSGCASTGPRWDATPTESAPAQSSAKNTPTLAGASAMPVNTNEDRQQAQVYSGQSSIAPARAAMQPAPSAHYQAMGGDIALNFSDVPVREAARIILSDQLGKEFSVAPQVQGNVSLNDNGGLAKQDLVPTLRVLLASVNAQLNIVGDRYDIVQASSGQSPVSSRQLEIIPLRYIEAREFSKLVAGYGVSATPFSDGNLLAVNGSSAQVAQVRELARSFDINWLRGRSVGLFPVQNTSAATLRKELLDVLGKELGSDDAQALRIVAVERTNSVMVIANHINAVNTVKQWVDRLDKVDSLNDQAFFIYRVQNGRASDLATLVQSMFGTTASSNEQGLSLNDQRDEFGEAPNEVKRTSGSFNVIADESTNSLIVTGSPHYYKAVRDAMKQLDSTPLQVLVEASIMELTLTDDLQYGLEWFLDGSRSNTSIASSLDFGASGIGAIQPGFSYVLQRAGNVRAALNGLADDSRLKVLSSPSLMVLNNRTASILVGDEVPIPTRQAVSNISPEAPTVNEIEYRNTGILLTVTPRVNSGGMVTMDISQEVSSVVDTVTSQIDAPTIQQRQINSTVSIRDGQSVVLGGLIRDQSSDRDAGIPFLKNIPGVGKLFSNTSTVAKRTELVVLITPRVIASEQDTDAITQEFKSKMLGLRPLQLNQL